MAKAAISDDLKRAMRSQEKETERQVKKMDRVFKAFGAKAKRKTCKATMGLLAEAHEIGSHFKGSPAIDAALIAAAQKVAHHGIASYGCLHQWATLLGNEKAASLLQEILDQEKATDESLTELALRSSNREALGYTDVHDAHGGMRSHLSWGDPTGNGDAKITLPSSDNEWRSFRRKR
jgi:ferritin-like metal-binding protein YciE